MKGLLRDSDWGSIVCIPLDTTPLRRYNPVAREDKAVLNQSTRRSALRFGVFEFDPGSGELRKGGILVHLAPQPAKVLGLLASRSGQILTRDEIREQVWGNGTFVDFDQGLNHCIKQIRAALCDEADTPRYIQTLSRRGYRFIAHVEAVSEWTSEQISERPVTVSTIGGSRMWRSSAAGIVVAIAMGMGYVYDVAGLRSRFLPGTMTHPRIASLAVLPLENLSGDAEQEYFADGMTEELITALGRIRGLRVTSRTSVMRYKGTQKPVPQIARELGVDALIEGTVTRSGGRMRLTTNLIHAATDRHLWAEAYDRDLGEILSLQRELAETVAKQVRTAFPVDDWSVSAKAGLFNPEAHELYLKGQYHYYKWSKPEFAKAITYYERAVSVDPNYAQAYLGLAKTYGFQWMQGTLPPDEAYPKFNAALKRALAINEDLPEAHYVLAVSAWYFYWNWPQAEAEFKRALGLNPNLEEARFEYAWFLSTMGRHAEAIVEAKRAVELDPLSVSANLALGSVYHYARQDDEAIPQLLKTIELDPTDPKGYEFLGSAYKSLGLYDKVVGTHRMMMLRRGAKPEEVEALSKAYKEGGYPGFLRWRLKRAGNPYQLAVLQAELGLKDEAFKNLELAYRQRWWAMVRLAHGTEWGELQEDPRFQALLTRMKFPR